MNTELLTRVASSLAAAVFIAGCGVDSSTGPISESISAGSPSGTSSTTESSFDSVEMIADISGLVITAQYETAANLTSKFSSPGEALDQYCESIGSETEASSESAAQEAWRQTMAAIQAIEMHAIGPAAKNEGALRNRVLGYSNGTLSTCGIDQAAILNSREGFAISTRAANQRGFGAVGYLLFNEDLTHSCASQVPETQSWDALTTTEKKAMRCSLAQTISADVAEATQTLSSEWQAYGPTFNSVSENGASLQLMTDAFFALDKLVKDQKLAVPLGIKSDCSSTNCASVVESIYSENTFANIRTNLISFRELFSGGDGLGFDDLIREEGFPEVTQRFIDNTNAAIDIIDNHSGASLYEEASSITSESASTSCANAYVSPDTPSEYTGCRLTGAIKRVTDDLKIDFVTIVGTSIPDSAQTDND